MSIQVNGTEIGSVYYGESPIGEIYHGAELVYSSGVKLIINTTPADAVVSFDVGKISGHKTKVEKGTVVNYTVSQDGYYSVSGSLEVTENKVIDVVLEQRYYNDGQVLWESGESGASANLNLLTTGRYQVICIAGGGGASERNHRPDSPTIRKHWVGTGGSGSGFNCVFKLTKGIYAVNVGNIGVGYYTTGNDLVGKVNDGGNSRFGDCYAYGGGGGTCGVGPTVAAGAAGAAPTLAYTIVSIALNQAGNAGTTTTTWASNVTGGASIYGSYGKGGDGVKDAAQVNGTAGYVKVVFLGR